MTKIFLIALILSATLLAVAVFGSVWICIKQRRTRGDEEEKSFLFTPLRLLLTGCFVAGFFMFFPIYYSSYFALESAVAREVKSVLLSIHNTVRLFIIDADFETVAEVVSGNENIATGLGVAYSVYASILYLLAPLFTAGFVLSFFKDAFARLKYRLYAKADIFVMSELNERSMALAEDILFNKEKR